MTDENNVELTAEEIQRKYDAAMDSVNLLKNGKPKTVSEEHWSDMVQRNVDHLKIMLEKDFWGDHDLKPFKDAVKG